MKDTYEDHWVDWLKSNPKIVCLSGYMDPLHIGHLEVIKQAKQLGDYLIVIINNTSQTISKKGYEFMPAEQRIEIVRSLKYVDECILSIDSDDSVAETLLSLSPSPTYFVNGGDRSFPNVKEAKVCKDKGIEMIFGLGPKIQSSSELVKNALKSKAA